MAASSVLGGCADIGAPPAFVEVSGDAFSFGPGASGRIAGASVRILEDGDLSTQTDADGHFAVDGLVAGDRASFIFEAEGYPVVQTKTFTIDEELERVTFQVPSDEVYDLLATVVSVEPDPARCQLVSTVTRIGKSVYDEGAHGVADVIVTLDPPVDAESGPIYFNASVIPDRSLTMTSEDGGVLFVNVPPGTYTMRATKDGMNFEEITMECRAGVVVNASPPYGLQAY